MARAVRLLLVLVAILAGARGLHAQEPEYDYELPSADDAGWRFSTTVPVQPKIEIVDWVGLEVPRPDAEVPSELVDQAKLPIEIGLHRLVLVIRALVRTAIAVDQRRRQAPG